MLRTLSPRAISALAVVATSFCLLLLFMMRGSAVAAAVGEAELDFTASVASAFLSPLGLGAYVLMLVPFVWGIHVLFREQTPDLHMRAIGTVLFAISTACLVGVLNVGEPVFWAGHVGSAYGGWIAGLADVVGMGVAGTLGWALVLFFWLYSLVLATDWLFHSIRRGEIELQAAPQGAIATEPTNYELMGDDETAEPRRYVAATDEDELIADEVTIDADFAADEVVATWTEAAVAESRSIAEAAQAGAAASEDTERSGLPRGWSTDERAGRTVLRAPTGYQGVEFLPVSDELAVPDEPVEPEPEVATDFLVGAALSSWNDHVEVSPTTPEPTAEQATEDVLSEQPTDEVHVTPQDLAAAAEAAAVSAPAAPSIGYPERDFADNDLLVDEVFSMDRIFSNVQGFERSDAPSDGASAAEELVETFAPSHQREQATPVETEVPEEAPQSAAAEVVAAIATPTATNDEPTYDIDTSFLVDDVFVSDVPLVSLDDVVINADARTSAPPTVPADEATPAADVTPAPAIEVTTTANEIVEVVTTATPEPELDPIATAEPAANAFPLFPETSSESPAAAQPATPPTSPTAPSDLWESRVAQPDSVQSDVAGLQSIGLDPLFRESIDAILSRGRASAVVLQSQLGIGYSRANRILDQMTEVGVTGPETPTGAREIRLPLEELRDILASQAE